MTDTAKDKPKKDRKPAVERAPHIRAQATVIRVLEPLSEAERRKVIRSVAALFDAEAYFGTHAALAAGAGLRAIPEATGG